MKKTGFIRKFLALLLLACLSFSNAALAAQGTTNTDYIMGSIEKEGQQYIYYNGKWFTENEFQSLNLEPQIVYWTIEEFSLWIEQQMMAMEELVSSRTMFLDNSTGKMRRWTQDDVDRMYEIYQNQLDGMKKGYKYMKPFAGLVKAHESLSSGSRSEPASIILRILGDVKSTLQNAEGFEKKVVTDYLKQLVKQGILTEEMSDLIISLLSTMTKKQ